MMLCVTSIDIIWWIIMHLCVGIKLYACVCWLNYHENKYFRSRYLTFVLSTLLGRDIWNYLNLYILMFSWRFIVQGVIYMHINVDKCIYNSDRSRGPEGLFCLLWCITLHAHVFFSVSIIIIMHHAHQHSDKVERYHMCVYHIRFRFYKFVLWQSKT